MRSIIEEIAVAERQADEIRAAAVSAAREQIAKAGDEAGHAVEALEAEEREAMKAALVRAELDGEALAKNMAEQMNAEADAVCGRAAARMPEAVAYRLNKVQSKV